jgi:arginyl-tRNA synthetase
MKYVQNDLKAKMYEWLKEDFQLDMEDIRFSIPSNRAFGHLSTTLPFVLAKKLKQKPFLIGKQIIEKLEGKQDMFSEITLAGGGFLNFSFKKGFLLGYLTRHINREPAPTGIKMVVEHTSINPNKSAHIGHLRNACLGDTLARSLKFLGYDVEVQNYLDDTGIQVADVVWGLMYYKKLDLEGIEAIDNLASYLWYLYPEVSSMFAEDETAKKGRDIVHQKIEEKHDPEYQVSNYIAEEVLKDHIRVMNSLGIRYDLLVRESDIIALDFFEAARQLMEEKGVMYTSQDPEKKGCKVIKYEKENIEKIIIRSNGTITYIGKDIAYTLWKVGLFDRDFYYRKFYTYEEDNKDIYMTGFTPNNETYDFGGGESVYNVIDVRQAYLQNIIAQILGPLSPPDHRKKFIHFAYEMVALTPRCVEEMGFEISEEERNKSYVEVSGRKGIAIKGDDLIAKLIETSLGEVISRHPELSEEKAGTIARDIAIGALRYFMIKYSINSVIAFDFEDALALQGDTGPYLQYPLVRINSILKKIEESGETIDTGSSEPDCSILDDNEYEISHDILLDLSLLELQVELALENHEPSVITTYTYTLCQKFNHYYHKFPVIAEENEQKKQLRLQLILLVKRTLEKLFTIMGIPVPEMM